jgi:hypothetical protein
MKKRIFQNSALLILGIYFGVMVAVTVIAMSRRSGVARIDTSQMALIRMKSTATGFEENQKIAER